MVATKTVKWNLTPSQARAVFWLKVNPNLTMLLHKADLDFALKNVNEFKRAKTFSGFLEKNLIELVGEDNG